MPVFRDAGGNIGPQRRQLGLPADPHVAVLEARIAPIDSGQFLVIIRDKTAERRAEQQLSYQADLLENLSDAVISVDIKGQREGWGLLPGPTRLFAGTF